MYTHQIYVFIVLTMLLVLTVIVQSKPLTALWQAQRYLMNFGYLSPASITYSSTEYDNVFRDAVQDFQSFADLNSTGELDSDTMKQMSLPRCGVRDKVRFEYHFVGSHWVTKSLTYNILSYPMGFPEDYVDGEIARAFALWSESTVLSFTHKKVGPVHINIKFAVGEHGDSIPFDGRGGSLAHAFFPAGGGDIHFDDDEWWAIGGLPGVNIFQLAAHELGHSVGLGHSSVVSALMHPFYDDSTQNIKLHPDDITGVESLYGKTDSQDNPSDFGPPHLKADDELCRDPKIDTIFNSADGQIFAFKGNKYYQISKSAQADGYPKLISNGWPGLPGDIDAAFAYKPGKTYFFKGTEYWRYSDRRMDNNFPRNIRDTFIGLPNNLDTAMVWNDNIYFYKGSQFWRFELLLNSPTVKYGYPKSISIWNGLPNDLDASIQLTNGVSFYFKGDEYFQLDNGAFTVTEAIPPFPRPLVQWWFFCDSAPLPTGFEDNQSEDKFNIGSTTK